ncbi:hypothetical protein BpHYR1_050850 [Brachionus plicatilis]|uniref:Uncharacterized protein n=1 Tax=Brachionus plicatilis TaxID=10195 RepID=A0A3M7SBP8_BRAPC|nr:hypothetical protein BpHYR1_050850 [Brachionus plicatilis]
MLKKRFLLSKWLYKKNSYDLIELSFPSPYKVSMVNNFFYKYVPFKQETRRLCFSFLFYTGISSGEESDSESIVNEQPNTKKIRVEEERNSESVGSKKKTLTSY